MPDPGRSLAEALGNGQRIVLAVKARKRQHGAREQLMQRHGQRQHGGAERRLLSRFFRHRQGRGYGGPRFGEQSPRQPEAAKERHAGLRDRAQQRPAPIAEQLGRDQGCGGQNDADKGNRDLAQRHRKDQRGTRAIAGAGRQPARQRIHPAPAPRQQQQSRGQKAQRHQNAAGQVGAVAEIGPAGLHLVIDMQADPAGLGQRRSPVRRVQRRRRATDQSEGLALTHRLVDLLHDAVGAAKALDRLQAGGLQLRQLVVQILAPGSDVVRFGLPLGRRRTQRVDLVLQRGDAG